MQRIGPVAGAEQRKPSPSGACRGRRALCGWSPPALSADSSLKDRVDRFVLGNVAAVSVFVVVVVLLNLAPHLGLRAGLAVDGVAALSGGGWCSINFWRCRHAHCLVTGPGWLALGALAFVEAGLGRSLVGGNEQLLFLGALVFALVFEILWQLTRHTNAVARG